MNLILIRREQIVLGILLAQLASPTPSRAQLNPNCTVSILNRTAQVDANGNWFISNVPTNLGLVRVHAVCTQNGQTTFGSTSPQTVVPSQTTGYDANITLGPTDFTPAAINMSAPSSILNQVGATLQLSLTATYPAGGTADVTASITGTSYLSSNPGILTVTPDGLVTARSRHCNHLRCTGRRHRLSVLASLLAHRHRRRRHP
jgi:hypothetical protein